jgi:putative FmdB family regulatory protein
VPTYQYACTECGHRFEAVQSFTDDSLTTCPVCSGQLRKVYGSVGVVFKGSGFYRTDSREKSKSGTNGAGEKSGDKVAAKAEKTGAEKTGSEKKADTPAKAGPAASSAGTSSGGSKAAAV